MPRSGPDKPWLPTSVYVLKQFALTIQASEDSCSWVSVSIETAILMRLPSPGDQTCPLRRSCWPLWSTQRGRKAECADLQALTELHKPLFQCRTHQRRTLFMTSRSFRRRSYIPGRAYSGQLRPHRQT